ncbi:MAG: TIM44-like domain-containing protein [Burkholderiales bacterium]
MKLNFRTASSIATALAFLSVGLTLTEDSYARAGGGFKGGGSRGGTTYRSQGSMGSKTYNTAPTSPAKPIERSQTTNAGASSTNNVFGQPAAANAPRAASPLPSGAGMASGGSWMQRNPMLTGLGAGLFGSWLGSKIFGGDQHMASSNSGNSGDNGWSTAAEQAPAASSFGTLLKYLLIGGVCWFLYRRFKGRANPVTTSIGGGNITPRVDLPQEPVLMGRSASIDAPSGTSVSATDTASFVQLLTTIQAAWSQQKMSALKTVMTPEMVEYFSDALANNVSQGVENHIEHIANATAELVETWEEPDVSYVTADMRWDAIDYTTKMETSELVEGDSTRPVASREIWTFVRAKPDGKWLLSAIQQAA